MDIPTPSELETALFKKQLKAARLKSAVIAFVPTIIFLSLFIAFFPYKTAMLDAIIIVFLLVVVPFTLTYQFVFSLGFGKNLLPILYKKQKVFEHMPYEDTDMDAMIDELNIARGHGPGKGYLASPSPSNINWDSHHYY